MLFTHERKVIFTMKFSFNKNAQNEQNVELTEQELAQVNGAGGCGDGHGHGHGYGYEFESYQDHFNHHNQHHYYNPCHNYNPCYNPCNNGGWFN